MSEPVGLYEYNSYEIDLQADYLHEDGVFLVNRIEGEYKINLHSLYGFYVEVWYNAKKNEIERFRTFKSVSQLEPYLELIEINL